MEVEQEQKKGEEASVMHEVVSNDLGERIRVNDSALRELKTRTCGLCTGLHVGKTLQIKSPFVFSTDSEEEDESFCYMCTGRQLPVFMSAFFKGDPKSMHSYWQSYYKKFKTELIDFSSPDTIRLVGEDGQFIAPNIAGEMGSFGYRFYLLSKKDSMLNNFLLHAFLEHLRNTRSKNNCPVQVMHDMCVDESISMMQRVIPSSAGYDALQLIPPRVLRETNVVTLRDMRRVSNFGHFIAFLKKYK